ncbi:hypothetical protein [Flavobacterium sp. TBRC 19031]|uniref:hypothetical protein n=1 Tax=Flavobacterium mekongense TaxID=3379707 RepID=UPI00399B072E
MKSKLLLSLLLLSFYNVSATDRIVQENGPAGTFSTITAAIAASVNGDRIIVHPKIGGNPYVENITIDKTLEIASAEDGVRYKIQGNVTLQALNNRTITIIGAHLVSGDISGSSAGWRTNVSIMGCILDGGSINFNNQYYVSVVSTELESGSISISHGRIIGNQMNSESALITISNSTSITNDTLLIVANKFPRLLCTSDIFLTIMNNLIKRVSPQTVLSAHSISYTTTSTQQKLNIINNTVVTPYTVVADGSSTRAKYLNLLSPAVIMNNIFQASYVFTSMYAPTASLTVSGNSSSYNYIMNTLVSYPAFSTTDVLLTTNPVNVTTGQLILPTAALNGADPSFQFYDLDLSVGDAGCYGGSYSLDNYFPITGSSRVFWVDMPFGITTNGAPLQIKAEGFDR